MLADADLLASAVLSPGSFARAEGALLSALDGSRGLTAAGGALELRAGQLLVAVARYRASDVLAEQAVQARRWLLLGAAPALAPLAVGAGLGWVGGVLAAGGDPLAELERALTEHPGVIDEVLGTMTLLSGPLRSGLAGPLPVFGDQAFRALTGESLLPRDLAEAAGLLALLYGPGRPVWERRVDTDETATLVPGGIGDVLERLDHRNADATIGGGTQGDIGVTRVVTLGPDGRELVSWIVDIPGTKDWQIDPSTRPALNDAASNLELMAGIENARVEALTRALADAGVAPDQPVMLVGHSQGGMVAVRAAQELAGRLSVTHVVTAGSPVGGMTAPDGVQVLSLENRNDVVPHTDGRENEDDDEHVTVLFDHSGGTIGENHGTGTAYLPAARALDLSADPSVRAWLEGAAGLPRRAGRAGQRDDDGLHGHQRHRRRREGRPPALRACTPTRLPVGQDRRVSADPLPYPRHWEADVVLTDGGTVHLRPILADDADRLRAFHAGLSKETVYNRFFAYRPSLSDADVARFTQVDHDDRVALVATLRDEIIGVVRYDRLPGSADAEVAFVVDDAHQGRGLGAVLLEHLAAAARERGIDRFVADVLPTNRAMLTVFRSAGYEVTRDLADGYVSLDFPIRPTETSLEVMRAREHRAEARSVQRLLAPRSVAVVGASREPGAPGHELLKSLLRNGFEGPVYPINPAATSVSGVRAYADVREVPDPVDLAVIAVPAAEVADVVRACAAKRVRGLVVVSGGFGDAGEEGRARLEEVVRLARTGGMRLIGPSAMGVVNTDPAVRLHATFAVGSPPVGAVGVLSQSGALAGTFLAEAERRALGLSAFVSIGDRADVSGNDLLQHWQADERTEVVLLHLQGFGNPRKFTRIARRLGRTKPVVALKSGHGAGDVAVDALFASAGVVRVRSLGQLFTTAQLFALQPLPQGRRVGIVGNSSALAAMAADACREAGLEVPVLPEAAREPAAWPDGGDRDGQPGGPRALRRRRRAAGGPRRRARQRSGRRGARRRRPAAARPRAGAGGRGAGRGPATSQAGDRCRCWPASSDTRACRRRSRCSASRARRCAGPSPRTPRRSPRPSPCPGWCATRSGGRDRRAWCRSWTGWTCGPPGPSSPTCRWTGSGSRRRRPRRCCGTSASTCGPPSWCRTPVPPWPRRTGSAGRSRSRRPTSGGATGSTSVRCGSGSRTPTTCARRGATCSRRRAGARRSCSRWPRRASPRSCTSCRTRRPARCCRCASAGWRSTCSSTRSRAPCR